MHKVWARLKLGTELIEGLTKYERWTKRKHSKPTKQDQCCDPFARPFSTNVPHSSPLPPSPPPCSLPEMPVPRHRPIHSVFVSLDRGPPVFTRQNTC